MSAQPVTTLMDAHRRRADRARQVADVLRHQVLDGVYLDAALPKEDQLCQDFHASRNTVRDALALLVAEGLVERVPGVGTTAMTGKVPHGLHRLMGLGETLRDHGEIINELRAVALIRPPAAVARRLSLESGDRVVYVERVRHLAGLPLSLDLTYLAPDIGEPLLGADLAHRDIFGLVEELAGQPLGAAEISIEAVNADPHTAALLETTDRAALLMVERLTRLADGRPVDLEWIRFRGDRITMQGELRRAGH